MTSNNKKVLVLGGTGLLGFMLMQVALKNNLNYIGTTRNKNKITQVSKNNFVILKDANNIKALKKIIKKYQPKFVVNCLSLSKENQNNFELLVNLYSVFPKKLLFLSKIFGFKIINISSDGVFKGDKKIYTEFDLPDSEEFYGKCKYLGEINDQNVLNLRTSIIGPSLIKNSLFDEVLSRKKITGYTNYIFNGVTNLELSNKIISIISNKEFSFGTIHVSGEKISKYNLIKKIKNHYKLDIQINKKTYFPIKRILKSYYLQKYYKLNVNNWDKMISDLKNYDF